LHPPVSPTGRVSARRFAARNPSLRRAYPHPVTLSEEDEAAYVAAQGEYDALTD
jgi:hypothetical protein